jgi:hypothetical protein
MDSSKGEQADDRTPPPRPDRRPRGSDTQPLDVANNAKQDSHAKNGEDAQNHQQAAATQPPTRRNDEDEVRDMHGFKIHGQEYIAVYKGWIPLHQKKLAERKVKWMELFRKSPGTSYLQHKDLKKLVRKGVPDSSRGEVWMDLSGAKKLLLANAGVYR